MTEKEKNILLSGAYQTMSDEELRQVSQAINMELVRRDRIAKEKAWRAIHHAIRDYVTVYGSIEISDGYEDITITAQADFDTIGKIDDFLPDD